MSRRNSVTAMGPWLLPLLVYRSRDPRVTSQQVGKQYTINLYMSVTCLKFYKINTIHCSVCRAM